MQMLQKTEFKPQSIRTGSSSGSEKGRHSSVNAVKFLINTAFGPVGTNMEIVKNKLPTF